MQEGPKFVPMARPYASHLPDLFKFILGREYSGSSWTGLGALWGILEARGAVLRRSGGSWSWLAGWPAGWLV